ncbi:MAG: DUF5666 domain-containing protein [Methyloligellaceae bacterium]
MTRHLTRRSLSALLAGWIMLVFLLAAGGCATSLGSGGAPSSSVAAGTRAPEQANAGTDVAQMQTQPGIGGTGKQESKSPGIGGTGQIAGAPPGIGGTGGTGIIGTVTGFGSVLVNGLEIDYAPDLPVAFKDRTLRPDALRIGQVVAIEAQGSGNRLRASRLSVRHEVAGPIERIDPVRRIAVVFGQRIEIPEGVISAANGSRVVSIHDLAAGDHIDVSGLRRANGVIAASRIDKTGPGVAAVLRGRVTASGQSGFSVNGVRIDAPFANRPGTLASGKEVLVIGAAIRGRLRARRINLLASRPFSGRVRRLSVEGYVRRAISGGVAIGRMPISQLPARTNLQAGQRIILDGSMDARGRLAAKRLHTPRINLRHPGRSRGNFNRRPPPRRQVLPPATPPPVIRDHRPSRPPVYHPPPRRLDRPRRPGR